MRNTPSRFETPRYGISDYRRLTFAMQNTEALLVQIVSILIRHIWLVWEAAGPGWQKNETKQLESCARVINKSIRLAPNQME